MFNKIRIGILCDPAKIDLYDDEFYDILKTYPNDYIFHLIGASEKDVTKEDYERMYERFRIHLKNYKLKKLFTGLSNSFSSRIGLFPTSASHLIKGPEFIFGPFPLNSKSRYLKFKSKVSISFLGPFIKPKIFRIAYCPFGGKASQRTKADLQIKNDQILDLFQGAGNNKWFDYFYLEAGSGEDKLGPDRINSFLRGLMLSKVGNFYTKAISPAINRGQQNIIVPRSIYGGGIKSIEKLCNVLACNDEGQLIPENVIVGNISEENLSMTFRLIERIEELNN